VSTAAIAAEPPKPDYSPEALRQILVVASEDERPSPGGPSRFHAGIGYVGWTGFGINWKFYYLPMLMPFSASVRYSDPALKWPDPFAETHTQFAETPRNWRDNREVSKERKRLESMAKVVAKP